MDTENKNIKTIYCKGKKISRAGQEIAKFREKTFVKKQIFIFCEKIFSCFFFVEMDRKVSEVKHGLQFDISRGQTS